MSVSGAQFRGRIRHLPLALVAAPPKGETAHHLGLQDPVSRRAVSAAAVEGHLHRRGPGASRGLGFEMRQQNTIILSSVIFVIVLR